MFVIKAGSKYLTGMTSYPIWVDSRVNAAVYTESKANKLLKDLKDFYNVSAVLEPNYISSELTPKRDTFAPNWKPNKRSPFGGTAETFYSL
jgi:hypothetical protein